jgi:hypothetical protein
MKRDYKDEDIEIYKLVEDPTHPILKGFTFENCTIIGPAVVASLGSTKWVGNSLSTSMFIVIPKASRQLEGVIGLRDCTITGCKFMNVGLIGPEDFIKRFFD